MSNKTAQLIDRMAELLSDIEHSNYALLQVAAWCEWLERGAEWIHRGRELVNDD